MTDVNLTTGEVAQFRSRLYQIQMASKTGRMIRIFNQARLLLELLKKAERRQELKHRKSKRNKMNTYNIEPNRMNGGLYCKRGIPVSREALVECIEDFKKQGNEKDNVQ